MLSSEVRERCKVTAVADVAFLEALRDNSKAPWRERRAAAETLLAYAIGKPAQSINVELESASTLTVGPDENALRAWVERLAMQAAPVVSETAEAPSLPEPKAADGE